MLPVRVNSFSSLKDKLAKMLIEGLVFRYKSCGCNVIYYAITQRHFKVKICEYLGFSRLTVKTV